MTPTDHWSRAKKILCVRLDALGDVLMTTPAIRALKDSNPQRQITLMTSPGGREVATLIAEVDEIITYDAPWMKATAPRSNSEPEFAMIERLRSQEFDAAVIFTVFSQNPLPAALLCYLAGIPLRLAHSHENPYQLLTDWVLDPEPGRGIRHEVRRQLDLVASVGYQPQDERLSLQVSDCDRQFVNLCLQELGLDSYHPWVVIHPGATAASRRYPPAGFAAVARQLIAQHHISVIFTGTAEEQLLIAQIQAEVSDPTYSLVGYLNLAQMAALLATAPLLISNNTGPVHLAAAVGTPVVDLYALTNPQHTPWGVPQRVLFADVPCKFCYKSICPEGHSNCLHQVTPDQVVQAACELLVEPGGTMVPLSVFSLHPAFAAQELKPIATATATQQSAQGVWR